MVEFVGTTQWTAFKSAISPYATVPTMANPKSWLIPGLIIGGAILFLVMKRKKAEYNAPDESLPESPAIEIDGGKLDYGAPRKKKVHSVYDAGENASYRYIVVLTTHKKSWGNEVVYDALFVSQGQDISEGQANPGVHLGKKIEFEALPEGVKSHVNDMLGGKSAHGPSYTASNGAKDCGHRHATYDEAKACGMKTFGDITAPDGTPYEFKVDLKYGAFGESSPVYDHNKPTTSGDGTIIICTKCGKPIMEDEGIRTGESGIIHSPRCPGEKR